MRLTVVRLCISAWLPDGFPGDLEHFVRCSSSYRTDPSLSLEVIIIIGEVELEVTHPSVHSMWERGEKMPGFSPHRYAVINYNISGAQEGEVQMLVCPAKVPFTMLLHVSQQVHSLGHCYRTQTQARSAWFFTFRVVCLLWLLEEVKLGEINLACVCKGSSAEDVFLHSA